MLYLSLNHFLIEPVQLEIQHCVSIEKPAHSNYLSFATAPSDEASCEFQPVKGAGEFSIGSRYGSISITEFSLWSIIKRFRRRPTAAPSPTNRYFGQVMYENIRPGREWLMIFLLCKDFDALSQVYTCMHALSL